MGLQFVYTCKIWPHNRKYIDVDCTSRHTVIEPKRERIKRRKKKQQQKQQAFVMWLFDVITFVLSFAQRTVGSQSCLCLCLHTILNYIRFVELYRNGFVMWCVSWQKKPSCQLYIIRVSLWAYITAQLLLMMITKTNVLRYITISSIHVFICTYVLCGHANFYF